MYSSTGTQWDLETAVCYYRHRMYHTQLGRFGSRDPIGFRGGDNNLYRYVRNTPVTVVDPLGLKVYDYSRGYLANGMTPYTLMSAGDTVINTGIGTITVKSSNIEKGDADYDAGVCVLRKLGFSLPRSENGVYWGTWSRGGVSGYTLMWHGPFWNDINFSYIRESFKGVSSAGPTETFKEFAVTLYHEVRGHNIDEEEDGPTFDAAYEKPIYDKITEAKGKPGACCGNKLHSNLWLSYLCQCGVKVP